MFIFRFCFHFALVQDQFSKYSSILQNPPYQFFFGFAAMSFFLNNPDMKWKKINIFGQNT